MSTAVVKAATGEEIDEAFESGEDMRAFFDFSKGKVAQPVKKVNVDFTVRQVDELDAEAAYLGINRQAVIKTLCDEALTRRRAERRAAMTL